MRAGVARGSFHGVAYLVAMADCEAQGSESSRGQQEQNEQAHEGGANRQGSLQGGLQLVSPGGWPPFRPAWPFLQTDDIVGYCKCPDTLDRLTRDAANAAFLGNKHHRQPCPTLVFWGDPPKASWRLSGRWNLDADCRALLLVECRKCDTRCGVCCSLLTQPLPLCVSAAALLGSCCRCSSSSSVAEPTCRKGVKVARQAE